MAENMIEALERERDRLKNRLLELKPVFGQKSKARAGEEGKLLKALEKIEYLIQKHREEEKKNDRCENITARDERLVQQIGKLAEGDDKIREQAPQGRETQGEKNEEGVQASNRQSGIARTPRK